MARPRSELHEILVSLMGKQIATAPEKHVFYQPPESVKLRYPCIIYSLSGDSPVHADNMKYRRFKRYRVMVIDRNPDSAVPDLVADIPYCSFDRAYPADNLHHFVYDLYF